MEYLEVARIIHPHLSIVLEYVPQANATLFFECCLQLIKIFGLNLSKKFF
jgi:hypothetical protein